jgi:hypothetical protein
MFGPTALSLMDFILKSQVEKRSGIQFRASADQNAFVTAANFA